MNTDGLTYYFTYTYEGKTLSSPEYDNFDGTLSEAEWLAQEDEDAWYYVYERNAHTGEDRMVGWIHHLQIGYTIRDSEDWEFLAVDFDDLKSANAYLTKHRKERPGLFISPRYGDDLDRYDFYDDGILPDPNK